jgi:hypothetical protein
MAFTCSAWSRDEIVTPASERCKGHLFDHLVCDWWSDREIDPGLNLILCYLHSSRYVLLLDSALNCY